MQEYAKKKLFDRCHLLFEEYLQGKENHAEKQQMFGKKVYEEVRLLRP